jgi:putative endonuclease
MFGSPTGARILKPVFSKAGFFIGRNHVFQCLYNSKRNYGQSSNVEQRLRQHKDPDYYNSQTTKQMPGPWKLIWTQSVATRAEAMALETKIKKRGIGRYLAGPAISGTGPSQFIPKKGRTS